MYPSLGYLPMRVRKLSASGNTKTFRGAQSAAPRAASFIGPAESSSLCRPHLSVDLTLRAPIPIGRLAFRVPKWQGVSRGKALTVPRDPDFRRRRAAPTARRSAFQSLQVWELAAVHLPSAIWHPADPPLSLFEEVEN